MSRRRSLLAVIAAGAAAAVAIRRSREQRAPAPAGPGDIAPPQQPEADRGPAADQTGVDVVEPPVEERAVEEPVAEEPEPALEEPAVEDRAVDEPPVEEPPVEAPAVEEPTGSDPLPIVARVLAELHRRSLPTSVPPWVAASLEELEAGLAAAGDHTLEDLRLASLPATVTALGQMHRCAGEPDDLLVEVLRIDDLAAFEAGIAREATVARAAGWIGVPAERATELLRVRHENLVDLRSGAADQRLVADLLAGHPHVIVAEPLPDRVSALTRAVIDPGGLLLGEARARPVEERQAWAETIWRLCFGTLRRHGLALTGLDAPLVRFLDGGTVAIVRVGSVEHVDPVGLERYRRLMRAALQHDSDAVEKAIDELGGAIPREWHQPIVDRQRSPSPVDPAGPTLPDSAAPIDRLHVSVGAILDGLGTAPPVPDLTAELWAGAKPASELGDADQQWWESRETLTLLDRLAARRQDG